MTTAIEYALMAGASYISNRPEINQFPIPDGWIGAKYDNPQNGSGFEAISFIPTGATLATSSEIVISFAGTDFSHPGSDFMHGNVPLALGILSSQLEQAAEYRRTKGGPKGAASHCFLSNYHPTSPAPLARRNTVAYCSARNQPRAFLFRRGG